MKKNFFLFFILIFSGCVEYINLGNNYEIKATAQEELIFKLNGKNINLKEEICLGDLTLDSKKEFLFEIKNIGNSAFNLKDIEISNKENFTILKKPDKEIVVDATTDFIVEFKAVSIGRNYAFITIKSNISQYVIKIYANVILPEPEFVLLNPSVSRDTLLLKDLPATINFNVTVEKRYNAIIDAVIIDLSSINGNFCQNMFDDGTNGDIFANDNVYCYNYEISSISNISDYIIPITVKGNATEKTINLKIKITDLIFLNSDMENDVNNASIPNFTVQYIENDVKEGNRSIRIYGNTGSSNMDIFKITNPCISRGNLTKITFFLKGEGTKGLVLRIGSTESNYFNINDETKSNIIELSTTPLYSNKTLNASEWIKIELNVSGFNPDGKEFILRGGSNAFYDLYIDYIIFE